MGKLSLRPINSESLNKSYDAIIIGSGVGGLTTAVWLAKNGKKVLVLEQHYTAGGLLHGFKRKNGFKFDIGLHYVGNVGESDQGMLRKLFEYATEKKIKWNSLGSVYDVIQIADRRFELPAGKDNYMKAMIEYFPDEKSVIQDYLALIDQVTSSANLYFGEKVLPPFLKMTIGKLFRRKFRSLSDRTTKEVLETLTSNQDLITVLCGQCGDYGLNPDRSSFAAHAMVVNHFMNGGYFPDGGTDTIIHGMIHTLRKYGSEIYINSRVEELLFKKKRVVGVRVGDQRIYAKKVISNAGWNTTMTKLVPDEYKKKQRELSYSHVCLYVGLNKTMEELGIEKSNTWYYAKPDIDSILGEASKDTIAKDFVYISNSRGKNQMWEQKNPGKSMIQILTLGDFKWFDKYKDSEWMKREDEYLDLKNSFQDQLLNTLIKIFPQVEGNIIFTEVSTPLSTRHFTLNDRGEIYGLAHTPERFKNRDIQPNYRPIKGLYLVGQDVTIVGVAGAALSGMLTSIEILRWSVIKNFKQMVKGID